MFKKSKKYLLKSSIIFLVLFVFTINAFSVTQEVEVGKTYNLEELTELAINNSSKLKSDEYNKEASFKKYVESGRMTDFVPAAGFAVNDTTTLNVYKMHKSYDVAYSLSKKNLILTKDKIRNDVIKYFYEIHNLELAKKHVLSEFNYALTNMDIEVLKNNYGLISNLDNSISKMKYEVAKNNLLMIDRELAKAYENLNFLIGIRGEERYNLLYEDITDIMEALVEDDHKVFKGRATSNNIIVEMAEEKLRLKKVDIDFYAFNNNQGTTYESAKDELKSEEYSFNTTKEGIETFIRETFYQAQKVQEDYNKLAKKNAIDQDVHRIKMLQRELGMITDLELSNSAKTLLENESNLAALKSAYNKLIFILNNPHVQLA